MTRAGIRPEPRLGKRMVMDAVDLLLAGAMGVSGLPPDGVNERQ